MYELTIPGHAKRKAAVLKVLIQEAERYGSQGAEIYYVPDDDYEQIQGVWPGFLRVFYDPDERRAAGVKLVGEDD